MPMTCSAYRCNNHFYKGCGKQFFRFPVKDSERLSEWITAIKRKNWKPSESSRICSDHFTDKDYMLRPGATIPRLRLDAVPTVFDDPNKSLRERIKRKKTMETNETIILDSLDVKEDHVDNQDCIPKKKVPMTCSVPHCNNPISNGKGKHFFRFPINNPYRLSAWATAIKLEAWKPSGSSRICSDHFTDKDYVHRPGGTVPRLRVDAVPSVFVKHSEHVEEIIASEKEIKMKTHMQPATNKIIEVANIKQPLTTMPKDSVENVPCSQMDDNIAPEMRSASVSCVPCGAVTQGKNQTEQFNFRRSYLPKRQMCAVKGCKNTGITRRGTCFFRFPIGNPEQLSKWLTAIHRENWTPSVKSRICSGHFTNNDYKHSPGSLIPQLQAHAVPSVFTAKKGRKLKPVKDRTRNEVVPCTDTELQEEKLQPGILDHTYYAVQNLSNKSSPCRSLSIVNLRRRVKTLQRQTQRQRHTLKNLCQVIAELKKKNKPDRDPGSLSTDIQRTEMLI